MTIDGVWCTVGSANFDDRSFEINDEITLGFLDAATAKRLDQIFEKYAAGAKEIELEDLAKARLGPQADRQHVLPVQRGTLSTVSSAAISLGPIRQQPPINLAPALTHFPAREARPS